MKELLRIRISPKISGSNSEHIGYLIEDCPTKFRALNESKRIEVHYPKISYKYEVLSESR